MPIESQGAQITALPHFELPDLSGALIQVDPTRLDRPTVIVFACNHCPYVRSIETVLGQIAAANDDVAWIAICSNDIQAYPDDDVPGLRDQVQRAGWTFTYLVDTDQEVARAFFAVCTPDFFVFDATGALTYRGAMDDARPRQPQPVDGAHLIDALEAARNGHSFSGGKPSMGCGIKWKQD
ncbi:MAG TPA: thioredoxin family protein [Candidatus Nanopelagicales bacterium]|nr:thioredoxin family protein [Candidatus Nanopelagicales bacterium]